MPHSPLLSPKEHGSGNTGRALTCRPGVHVGGITGVREGQEGGGREGRGSQGFLPQPPSPSTQASGVRDRSTGLCLARPARSQQHFSPPGWVPGLIFTCPRDSGVLPSLVGAGPQNRSGVVGDRNIAGCLWRLLSRGLLGRVRELGLSSQGLWLVLDSGVPRHDRPSGSRGGAVEARHPADAPATGTAVCLAWAEAAES